MQHPISTKETQIRDIEEHLRWLRSMEKGYKTRVGIAEKTLIYLRRHTEQALKE